MALMNRMRQNTKIMLMILVVAFMLTIIIDWGMGGFKTGGQRGVIASVNGDDITYDEYYQQYQTEIAAYREQSGAEPESYQVSQIENRVFESLVQQRIMADIVKDLNLKSTNAEITEEIWNNPPAVLKTNQAFLDSNGVFDINIYQAALNNPAADQFWLEVEKYLRSTIPMQKLSALLSTTQQITDEDAKFEFMKTNQKAKVHYIFYNSANYQSVPEPTEEEITAYYNKHKKDFQENEKRVLDYLLLETKPTAADTQSTYNQAEDILDELKNGGNFESLATLYSKDPGSAEKGGDLGYFTRTTMVKPFADAAFSAKKGEIVGPVKSQFGLHIIKVEDKKWEDGEQKVKARHILLKFEPSPSTRDALREEAEYIAEYAKDSKLKTVVTAESLQISQTQPFEKGEYIPGIGMEKRINYFAYRSKIDDVSSVYNLDQGFLVASLVKIIPEHIKPLEEVKSAIITSLKGEKSMNSTLEHAQAAYDKIKSGNTFDQVADDDSLTVEETDFFNMTGYIAKVGREPAFAGTAFTLNIGEFSEPVKGTRGYYILQLIDKQEINEQDFENQKEQIKLQLAARYKQQVFGEWYEEVKAKANIKDYRELYF
ncbi:peptidylprolyl isomerase [candidate division KSB1 bacterium]|nr:peptidylprolyl isomerase [candidate division KSB1 bacterium]